MLVMFRVQGIRFTIMLFAAEISNPDRVTPAFFVDPILILLLAQKLVSNAILATRLTELASTTET